MPIHQTDGFARDQQRGEMLEERSLYELEQITGELPGVLDCV
jgi:hypothetical protein